MFTFMKRHFRDVVTIIVLLLIGILLLVNPSKYAPSLIRIVGLLLVVHGIVLVIRYFRIEPEEAAKSDNLSTGMIACILGWFCIFGQAWLIATFPHLAAFYGLFQLILGFHKLQRTVDSLRLKTDMALFYGASAVIYLIFGCIVIFHVEMTIVPVWTFTGITLLLEGIVDIIALIKARHVDDGVADIPDEKPAKEKSEKHDKENA